MGRGFLEAVYQECLEKELENQGIEFSTQVELSLSYKGAPLKHKYKPDFICYDKIILEIKAGKNLDPERRAQIINYLKATGCKLDLLINFGSHSQVQIERFVL